MNQSALKNMNRFGFTTLSCIALFALAASTGCTGVRYHAKGACPGPNCLEAAMASHAEACPAEPLMEAGQPEVLAPHARFHPVPTKPVFEPDYAVVPTSGFEPVPVQSSSAAQPTIASHDDDPAPLPDEALGKSILVKAKPAAETSTANVAVTISPAPVVQQASAVEPIQATGWRPRGTRR